MDDLYLSWQKALSLIEKNLEDPISFNTWIKPLKIHVCGRQRSCFKG